MPTMEEMQFRDVVGSDIYTRQLVYRFAFCSDYTISHGVERLGWDGFMGGSMSFTDYASSADACFHTG
jgi:hypothetical protein